MFAKWYFCRLFECKPERGCIHFCRPPTLNLFLCAANLLNRFCVKRNANSRNSQQVSTETPIHKPSWPPISANKLTSYKEHEGKLKSILRPVERKNSIVAWFLSCAIRVQMVFQMVRSVRELWARRTHSPW